MADDNTIFIGDNTGAFGNRFITINLINPLGYTISKAVFVCGKITKPFPNPAFPLTVNFTSAESAELKPENICYLVVYDEQGRQKTCTGTLKFNAQYGVICNNGCKC